MIIHNRVKKNNPLYDKIYLIWYHMNQRCYNDKNDRYNSYGAKGVMVCDRWKELNNFIEDIDKIDGFDANLLINGKISLDKDFKDNSNKLYCLEKCSFISKEDNNKYKPNQQRHFIAKSPNEEEFTHFNQSEFAREHKLQQSKISECLKGSRKSYKGWKFSYT